MTNPDVAAAIETVREALFHTPNASVAESSVWNKNALAALDNLVATIETQARERDELIAENQRWMTEGFLGPRDAKELMIEKQDAERRVEKLEGQLRQIESGLWSGAVRDFARRALEEEQA